MKTKISLLLSVIALLADLRVCKAQNANEKFSLNVMPAFVKELQQGMPSIQLMLSDPGLYQHLMQRRTTLISILLQEVAARRLPKTVLEVLNTQPLLSAGNNAPQMQKSGTNNFNLTKDINQSTDAVPHNYNYSFTNSYAVLNKVVYYGANDGIHGTELWRSDGTDTGTHMVKDINPGAATGNANYITLYKGKLYFTAYTDSIGYEIYQSDGTTAGTILLKDILPGIYGSNPARFTVANGTLYFNTDGDSYKSQLWKTDGTAAGTAMVADIYSLSAAYNIAQLTSANGLLFFTAYSYANGRELWRSNGTPSGTYMIKDINPNNNNSYENYDVPANLTSFNGLLYFSANGGSRTLWQSNGTNAGTHVVNYKNGITLNTPDNAQAQDEPFAIAQNNLFFAGYNSTTGTELYKYNPAGSAGITLVKDISAGSISSVLTSEGIRSMNENIYFVIPDFTGKNYSLWKSDGTPTNTKSLKKLPGTVNTYNFYALEDKLYFSTSSAAKGNEPWVSNGTVTGTKLLKDINAGANSSSPGFFTLCNKKVYFNAYSANAGSELWNTNGTTGGTLQVKDANITSTADGIYPYYGTSSVYAIALDTNKIIFSGYRRANGYEAWKSDGTFAGTGLLKELAVGENSATPQFYTSKNGKAYFIAYDYANGISSESIYATDGTAAGTKKLTDVKGNIFDVNVTDNGIVFYLQNDSGHIQLWRTDSSSNTYKINNNATSNMSTAGKLCYFTSGNSYGYELWISDGTSTGTYMIADINAGPGNSYPNNYTPFGNKMIFAATGTSDDTYLWISNGTPGGTMLLKNIHPYLNYGSAISQGKLYFNASDSIEGAEPYVTNGTPKGTTLLKDVYPGNTGSFPGNFEAVGNTVFFTASDNTHGFELWKTNGTLPGTKLVKDITAGTEGSVLSTLTAAGGNLYFVNSNQLWTSDGTAAKTKAVSDGGLSGIQRFGYLLGTGNKLFFAAYDYNYGYELYEGDATASKFISNTVAKTVHTLSLTAQLISNPIINDINLVINSPEKQQINITISNISGEQLFSKAIDAIYGSNTIIFDGKELLHGVYLINIISKTGAVILKAVK